jgi:hypothetical protein
MLTRLITSSNITIVSQVEYNTAIYDGRTIVEIVGNRLAVRAEMRRVMLASEGPEATSSSSEPHVVDGSKGRQRPLPPRIVADVHKVLGLLMDALEQLREGIKKDLTELFDAVRNVSDLRIPARQLMLYCVLVFVREGRRESRLCSHSGRVRCHHPEAQTAVQRPQDPAHVPGGSDGQCRPVLCAFHGGVRGCVQ